MNSHEPFFIVEDSLDQKLDDIAPLIHDDLSKSDYLEHFDLGKIFKSNKNRSVNILRIILETQNYRLEKWYKKENN